MLKKNNHSRVKGSEVQGSHKLAMAADLYTYLIQWGFGGMILIG